MEAFSLLKYWRGGGGLLHHSLSPNPHTPNAPTTLLTAVTPGTDDEDEGDDDGPFFDLEFTMPDDEADDSQDEHETPNGNHSNRNSVDDDEADGGDGDGDRDFKFTLSPLSNDRTPLSPSHDLLFEGKLAQVESSEPNSKPQFSASLLKSATKFRVFMTGLKKSKVNASEKDSNGSDSVAPKQPQCQHRKLFTVKFKVEEVPIVSLFSSRAASGKKSQKHSTEALDDKRFSKEVVQKYLKMVKPLYIRVSRKYEDKMSSGAKAGPPLVEADASENMGTNTKTQRRQGNLPAGLRVMGKHLGKSRSASSAEAAAPPGIVSSRRRDDSLLQQQDGIQGAILHCKRSFNASRECESSQMPRSVSDLLRKSTDEDKKKRL